MEMKTFYEFLRGITPLSDGFVEFLQASVSVQLMGKGEKLVSENQLTNKTWFVHSGLLKSRYFDHTGKQIITHFYKEQEIILIKNMTPAGIQARADQEIVLLEDCILFSVNSLQLQHIFDQYPEAHRISRKVYQMDLQKKDLRARLLVMPAPGAYTEFCHHFPCQRILLQDIASFLNIRPYSLSRIRARKS